MTRNQRRVGAAIILIGLLIATVAAAAPTVVEDHGLSWQQVFLNLGVPLLGTVIGGLIVWLNKLDQRMFEMQRAYVSRDEMMDAVKALGDKLDRLIEARQREE